MNDVVLSNNSADQMETAADLSPESAKLDEMLAPFFLPEEQCGAENVPVADAEIDVPVVEETAGDERSISDIVADVLVADRKSPRQKKERFGNFQELGNAVGIHARPTPAKGESNKKRDQDATIHFAFNREKGRVRRHPGHPSCPTIRVDSLSGLTFVPETIGADSYIKLMRTHQGEIVEGASPLISFDITRLPIAPSKQLARALEAAIGEALRMAIEQQ